MRTKKAVKFKGPKRNSAWKVGAAYLIRTVTHYWLGKCAYLDDKELVLTGAGWVASTGRYNETVRDGLKPRGNEEFEPVPGEVIIGRGSIVDAVEWSHEIPTTTF